MQARVRQLLQRPDVIMGRVWLETNDGRTLATQRALAHIPAPSGLEAARGAEVAERFRALKLADVRTDEAGNVLGRLGGSGGPGIVVAAHLDTVFGADVAHDVTISGARLIGPGIGDNARGLAAMLALAEVIGACGITLERAVTFVATVGEEGAGDLRGAKHLFADAAFRPEAFIALDGPGLERIVHKGVGSRRLRLTFRGPGGHSWAAFGVANPAHAVGATVAAIAALELPAAPRATASVVRLGGGTGLNTIPVEAWLDVDLRAEDDGELARLEREVRTAADVAREDAGSRRTAGTPPVELAIVSLGLRPSGLTPEDHALVQAALEATRALGANPQLAAASTDANVPLSLGIPSVALGAGGRGGDAHLPSEWYENTAGPAGILRALLVVLAQG